MAAVLQKFVEDEDGATAIEYGVIAALMGVALIAAFMLFGESLVGLFGFVRDKSVDAMGG
ncbi:MAG: Flp family type IVb pilin [Devosia sp.]